MDLPIQSAAIWPSGWSTTVDRVTTGASSSLGPGPGLSVAQPSFETTVRSAQQAAQTNQNAPAPRGAQADDAKAKQMQAFETFTMRMLIDAMLPKETGALFGEGTAGRLWRSALSEKIAEEITRDGRLQLLKTAEDGPASLARAVASDNATSSSAENRADFAAWAPTLIRPSDRSVEG
ncbi:MAG: hypothetical protein AAF732_07115 [Pseudomonadota bacterium]